jgi:Spy/CpxP family protein refolding chaperone
MKSTRFLAGVIVGTTLLCAQAVITPLPPNPAPYTAVKQYLGLSDAQMQSLQDVQKNRAAADQAIYKQISDKQTAINNLLSSGSNDALQIGQLTIDISNLRKQLPTSGAPFRDAALAVLTQDQKNKLPALTSALQLGPAGSQAIGLNLIDPVSVIRPLYFTPAPVPAETAPEAPQP